MDRQTVRRSLEGCLNADGRPHHWRQPLVYRDGEKCLIRVSRGVYRLADAFLGDSGEVQRDANPATPAHQRSPTGVEASAVGTPTDTGRPSISLSISGTPATFATAREKPWRAALERAIPQHSGGACPSGVRLWFTVEGTLRGGQPFDLDNLCEPVFSVLVNKKRYFGGARTNIAWWSAHRAVEAAPGCRIELADLPAAPESIDRPVFDGVYTGEFPRAASDTRIADWLQASAGQQRGRGGRFAVALRFGSARINLGDIATGPVKSIIDNLFPIVGGVVQAPEDWRIDRLVVIKSDPSLADDAVRIQVGAL